MVDDALLTEQLDYYRARAGEFDRWWNRENGWGTRRCTTSRPTCSTGRPRAATDTCVFSFWLSHVPEERFAGFWETVACASVPGGRVLFIDSARTDRSTAADHRLPQAGEATMTRRLDDGREFQIVKRFYDPAALESDLASLGFDVRVATTGEFFLYGTGVKT